MSTTSLGMPALPPRTAQPTWKAAWDAALYGPSGYLRRNPVALRHDRAALLEFVATRAEVYDAVVLLGAAGQLAPELGARRPGVLLRGDLPDDFDGLLVAVDWLAHVPTHVIQCDDDGRPRIVHVHPITGQEILGSTVDDSGVPPTIHAWLEQHWPISEPEQRAELGTAREAAWRDVVRRMAGGTAIAIESAHTSANRPAAGSLRSSAGSTIPDGERDLLADVAMDALAAETGGHYHPDPLLPRVEAG